jgi:hypothetical protein
VAEFVTTVGGVDYVLGDIGHTSGGRWSTTWPGGCESASVLIDIAPTAYSAAFSQGADFAVWDGPKRIWTGYVKEFEPPTFDGPARIHARGFYTLAGEYLALAADGLTPTSTPQTAVNEAINRGLPWVNAATLSTSPFSSAEQTVELNTLAALLEEYLASIGQRAWVDEDRTLRVAADPTTPRWFFNNAEPLRGVADDDYVTHLYGRYVSALTEGEPSAWATVKAGGAETGAKRREQPLDLRDLGFYASSSTPQAITTAELGLIGARYGYTSAAVPAHGELLTEGGAPGRLGHVKAGEMFRAFTVADMTGRVQAGLTADVVIGRTEYEDGADTVTLTPMDLAPRTFGAIQRAEKERRDREAAEFKGDAA